MATKPLTRGTSHFKFRPLGLDKPRGLEAPLPVSLKFVTVFGGYLSRSLPNFKITSSVAIDVKLQLNTSLPSLQLSSFGGGKATANLPKVTLFSTGTSLWGNLAEVSKSLPKLSISGYISSWGSASLSASLPSLRAFSYGGGSAFFTLPSVALTSSGTTGSVIRASLKLPSLSLFATGTTEDLITSVLTLPALKPLWGYAELALPSVFFTASFQLSQTVNKAYFTNVDIGETTSSDDFLFQWVVRFGNKYLAFTNTKEYEITGDTDDGANIDAYITLHPTDFETQHTKRVRYAYPSTPDEVSITTIVDDIVQGTYDSKLGSQRVQLALGSKGKYWKFKIANKQGKRLKIDGIDFHVDVLSRKV